ncbi:hypothetical protein [Paragemmobacter ruber]|uniref:Uncharacterized protein n=1 Tax=Paragemmobacter ruber TaxID=1985673 RepID=A0ABW9Y9D3_9RHOB|nr:hypothetical protein [Rhodobacter ruber]NBE09128.1 hypothetical protein [Rhodobacter ruber]
MPTEADKTPLDATDAVAGDEGATQNAATGDAVDQEIRRALDAAQAANEAAQDMADLSASHRAFAQAVMAGQKRNTLLAAGAAGGAAVALVLAGLVYFRSVEDLRIAAAVQTDAAKLLVEEVKQIDGIGDTVEAQQALMKEDLLATLELVKDEVRRAAMAAVTPEPEPEAGAMEAQMANAIRAGVKEDLDLLRDEILMALAEVDLGATENPEMVELLAGVRALVAAREAAGEAAGEAAAKPQDRPAARPASAPAAPAAPRPSRITPPPAEPNPFTYP